MTEGGPDTSAYSGGALRLDILDPSIATFLTRTKRPRGAILSSTSGTLVDATDAMLRHLEGTWTGRGGIHGPTILPRNDPATFGHNATIKPFENRLMTDERFDELRSLHFFVKQPREKQADFETGEKMQEAAPQFTLRNIERHEYDLRYPDGFFRDEMWRDPDEYTTTASTDAVLNYTRPDMGYTLSWDRMEAERYRQKEVIHYDPWEVHAGQWRKLIRHAGGRMPGMTIDVRRIKGRFGTPEEYLAEINEDLTHKYRRMPKRIWDIYRYR